MTSCASEASRCTRLLAGKCNPRIRPGRVTLASNSENTITMAASDTARSLAGKGAPLSSAKGSVMTPASVTAPRTPATDTARITRKPTSGVVAPRRRAAIALSLSDTVTQSSRQKTRPRHTTRP
ncbi:hypothetical protein D3C71_1538680 [compost metagenome]